MKRLWKASPIALVALLALASVASAKKRKVIIYQSASSPVWYEVRTERVGNPVYTYEVPTTREHVYVYRATSPVPEMGQVRIVAPGRDTSIFIDGQFVGLTANVMKVAVDEGPHNVELRNPEGDNVFSGNVNVTAGQTTQLQPDLR
jgi:PEGA domain-containing protein